MKGERYYALDGMRGIAAIAVVLAHIGLWTNNPWLFPHHMAVDFFFCLGGFLIAEAYGEQLHKNMNLAQFARTRVMRLYPVIALGTVLGFLFAFAMTLGSHQQPYSINDLFVALGFNLALIPQLGGESPVGDALYPLNSPFWSLLFQLLINFAWALYLRKLSPWMLFAASIAVAILTFAPLHSIGGGSTPGTFHLGAVRVFLGFSAGLAAHELLKSGRFASLPQVHPLLLLGILMALFTVPSTSLLFDLACAIVIFPAITLLGAYSAPGRSRRLLGWLGDISYPLYGIHKPVILFTLAFYQHRLGQDVDLALFTAVALPVTLLASTFAYHWFDLPVRRLLLRRRRRVHGALSTR